jgi:hypothetical protein
MIKFIWWIFGSKFIALHFPKLHKWRQQHCKHTKINNYYYCANCGEEFDDPRVDVFFAPVLTTVHKAMWPTCIVPGCVPANHLDKHKVFETPLQKDNDK